MQSVILKVGFNDLPPTEGRGQYIVSEEEKL